MRKKLILRGLVYVILITGAVTMLVPFYWMISTSFKPYGETGRFPPTIIPEDPTLQNYITVFTILPFDRFLINTLIVTVSILVGTIFLSSLTGFALSRLRLRGKTIVFYGLLAGLMLPFVILLIPNLILSFRLGIFNTYPGLIIPYIAWNLPIPTFLMASFFSSIPSSLEDSARIDGCSNFKIYYKIMLPLAKPMIATVAIFAWLYGWDELMWALTVTSSIEMRTFPVALTMFQAGPYQKYWNLITAASTIGFVFILVFFLALRKYFMPTGAIGGIKG